jgi:hypothetical protein
LYWVKEQNGQRSFSLSLPILLFLPPFLVHSDTAKEDAQRPDPPATPRSGGRHSRRRVNVQGPATDFGDQNGESLQRVAATKSRELILARWLNPGRGQFSRIRRIRRQIFIENEADLFKTISLIPFGALLQPRPASLRAIAI